MYKAFLELDCAIVEINPLVVTKGGDVVALGNPALLPEVVSLLA